MPGPGDDEHVYFRHMRPQGDGVQFLEDPGFRKALLDDRLNLISKMAYPNG
jgi:hypothetical protein